MTKAIKNHQTLAMGCHTLESLLKRSKERIMEVFCLPLSENSQARKKELINRLKENQIKISYCSKKELDKFCQSSSHQGIAAVLKKRENVSVDHFLSKNLSGLVVVLDSICDPQNLGAILRASECFGVDLVMWSKNRGAPLSPVVTKASSSASEFVPISIVSNLSTTLDKFIQAGYTLIGAQRSLESRNLFQYKFPKKPLLILGSEGEGIRLLLKKKINESLEIPMQGTIGSLNVSQAAALCIGAWSSQYYS